MCKRFIAVLTVIASIASPLWSATLTATGVVYQDANGNGRQDSGEAGLANVGVSNGQQIVRTDVNGRYELEVNDTDSMVFVLKPRNYQLPVDSANLPQFYYLHRPQGAPFRTYPGAEATGPLPDSINFGLLPRPEPDRFRVLVMADPQTTTQREVNFYRRDIIAELEGVEDIAFGMSLGDITNDDLGLYGELVDVTAKVGVPWFNVLGNHDMNLDAEDDRGSDDTFEAWFGPTTYAFQHGPVHFIYFDDVIHWRDADGEARYIGGLREDQLAFIQAYLESVDPSDWVVLGMHISLAQSGDGESFRASDRRRLFDLLKDHPNSLSLAGHNHLQQHIFMESEQDWQGSEAHHHYIVGTASGSWWSGELDAQGIPHTTMRDGTPNGYAIIEFAPEGYTIDYKAAREPADTVMRITGPGTVIADSYPLADIFVNVFNGSERNRLQYRIDNGAWQPMTKVLQDDPMMKLLALQNMQRNSPRTNLRLSPPIPSSHLWHARLSTDLAPGEHFVVVSNIDMFGREYRASQAFMVQAKGSLQ